MAIRFYICQWIADLSLPPGAVIPAIDEIVGGPWDGIVDGRADGSLTSGWMLVRKDVSAAQHLALVADARIRYIPIDDLSGLPLSTTSTLGDVPLANRTAAQGICEDEHIPVQDLTLQSTVKQFWKRFVRRCKLRQMLGNLDYTEGLDTQVRDIPNPRRSNVNNRLQAAGFDTSVIVGTDTIREALRKLMAQNVSAISTPFDD